jgi:hypothetical protein
MITYTIEKLRDVRPEMELLFPQHWEEVARDRETIKLNPDWPTYFALEDAGGVQAVIARSEGRVIGYHVSFLRVHLHYADSLHAFTDLYFILPEFRKGRAGIKLFTEVEKAWKARGVVKAFTGTKCSADKSRIFEHLGWNRTEYLYTKVLA